MGMEENKATVRRLFAEVLTNGDQAAARAIFHPDFIGLLAPGDVLVTPDGARGRANAISFREAAPDGQWTIDLLIGEGDYVVARWTFTGTHTGVFDNQLLGRFPPTGRRITNSAVNIYRFQDGQIIENWLHQDDRHLIQQLSGQDDRPTATP